MRHRGLSGVVRRESRRAKFLTSPSSAVRRRCLSSLDGLLQEHPSRPAWSAWPASTADFGLQQFPRSSDALLGRHALNQPSEGESALPDDRSPDAPAEPQQGARQASGPSPVRARSAWRRSRVRLRGRRGAWVAGAVAIVLAGTLASVLGAHALARSGADNARLAFHLSSTEVASTLTLAIQHEEDLIVSASAFVSANPHATPAAFDRWAASVRAMQRYPELAAISASSSSCPPHGSRASRRASPQRRCSPSAQTRSPRPSHCRSCRRAIARTTASRSRGWPATPPAISRRAWTTARSRRR